MRKTDSGILMLALRAWLDEDEGNARRIAELVYAKALAGHIGYFRFLLDTVDGPIRLSREEETTGEADWGIVVADEISCVDFYQAA
jgi:hypothetical protein